jgi:Zn-dependent protease
MTLPLPGGRSSAVRFRLLGFPVGVDLSFVVVLAFLGVNILNRGLAYLLVWIAVAAVSVLVHELGHALAARAAGAQPNIELYGFGGVTTFRHPPGGLSRARSIGISVAGPATGLLLGAALLLLRRRGGVDPGSLAGYALSAGIFVTLVWGVLNLLPILPLDGGNVLVELMPGPIERRRRLAAGVSIVVAAVAAVIALLAGQLYAALLAGWFAVGNVSAVRARPPAAPPALTPEQVQQVAQDSRAVLWLLDQGRPEEARHLAETAPAGVDPAVVGVLIAAQGDVDTGLAVVSNAVGAAPDDPLRQECARRVTALRPVDGAG